MPVSKTSKNKTQNIDTKNEVFVVIVKQSYGTHTYDSFL